MLPVGSLSQLDRGEAGRASQGAWQGQVWRWACWRRWATGTHKRAGVGEGAMQPSVWRWLSLGWCRGRSQLSQLGSISLLTTELSHLL